MPDESKAKGPASYFPSIEKTYGKPVADWFRILDSVKGRKHMDQVAFLKAEHKIGHGYANALVAYHREQKGPDRWSGTTLQTYIMRTGIEADTRLSPHLMLPNRLLARAFVSRGARLWLLTRALVCAFFLYVGINPFQLSAAATVGIIVLSVALGFVDIYRHRERVFIANLAFRPLCLIALFAAPAIIGEVALRFVVAAL